MSLSNILISGGLWFLLVLVYFPLSSGLMTLFSLVLMVCSLLKMNSVSRGISLLLFTAPVLGSLFFVLHIPITAFYICAILGFSCLIKELKYIKISASLLKRLLLLYVIFFLAYVWGPQHAYSTLKLIYIIVLGLVSLTGWQIMMSSKIIKHIDIAVYLGVVAMLYMSIAFDYYRFAHPSSLTDLDFFRTSFTILVREENLSLSYHSVGINAMIAMAFLICNIDKEGIFSKGVLTFISFLFVLIILSQTRQAMLGCVIIILVRILLEKKVTFSRKMISLGIVIVIAFGVLLNIKSEAMKSTFTASSIDKSLNRNYNDAFNLIDKYPLLGAGLGGYSTDGKRAYPHNLILELLCELGLIGTIIILIIVCGPIFFFRSVFNRTTMAGIFFFIIIIAYLIRSLMSGDLNESIVLLTAIMVYGKRSNEIQNMSDVIKYNK